MVGWIQPASASSGSRNTKRIAAHAKGDKAASFGLAALKLAARKIARKAEPVNSRAETTHRFGYSRVARQAWRWLSAAAIAAAVAMSGCARAPLVAAITPPPIALGKARVWFYRVYLPSDTLNMTRVTMNGAYTGYAQLGGAFYRDVVPGVYHIEVASYGRDFGQSTNVALVPGQVAYVQIESLRSWATMPGFGFTAGRDTFYARLIFPDAARSEIGHSFFDGGS
jgi:hypothetical protein